MSISTETSYFLLLADLQGSTRLPPQVYQRVTGRLGAVLHELTVRHADAFALPLTQQYGDEIAALLTRAGPIYDILDAIRDVLHPDTDLRCIVTHGRIGRSSSNVGLVGGPVFKAAQERMFDLKRAGVAKRSPILWEIGSPFERTVLQALSDLTNALSEDLSPVQRQVWRKVRQGIPQRQVAEELGKKPQSVSRAVAGGNVMQLVAGEGALRTVLEHVGTGSVS